MSRQRGIALILVLWLTTLLTVMAAAFTLSARRETQMLRGTRLNAQGAALCEGAMHYALGRLNQGNPLLRWRADGSVYEVTYGGGRVRLQMLDEAAKVDLNAAQDKLLQALLVAAGLEQDAAAHMADVIMDWRDADEVRRFQGAEAEDYRLTSRNFGPRNKPFYAIEELQTVLGMTPTLYQRLVPWITVHSRQPGINPRLAPAELLRRLPGMDRQAVENYLQARAQPNTEPATSTQGRIAAAPPLPPLPAPPGISFTSSAQRSVGVHAEAMLGDDAATAIDAVIGLGGGRQPLTVYRWHESTAGASLFQQPVSVGVVLDLPAP